MFFMATITCAQYCVGKDRKHTQARYIQVNALQDIYRLDAALARGVCAPESSNFIKCRFPPDHPYRVHI